MDDGPYFDGTCVPVYKANCSGYYIDPCNCTKYYQCDSNQYRLVHLECSQSTAFDGQGCVHINMLKYEDLCNFTAPWKRCHKKESDDRIQWLQRFCTNTTNTLIPSSTTPLNGLIKQAEKKEDNKDNTGLIVGLVIALVIIVILFAFGAFWIYRRRKQHEREGKSTLPQMGNPQYFAENDDDYQEIDESMHNPTYNAESTVRPSLPERPEGRTPNGTLQSANPHEKDFVYDNGAFRDETGVSQSLEFTTGNTANPHSYTTLKSVANIETGYDRVGTVRNALYSSESTIIAGAFVNLQSKSGEEAFRDESGVSQGLDCTGENTENSHSNTTLKSVENMATGYDCNRIVGNALYSSDNAMIGEAFVNSLSKPAKEA